VNDGIPYVPRQGWVGAKRATAGITSGASSSGEVTSGLRLRRSPFLAPAQPSPALCAIQTCKEGRHRTTAKHTRELEVGHAHRSGEAACRRSPLAETAEAASCVNGKEGGSTQGGAASEREVPYRPCVPSPHTGRGGDRCSARCVVVRVRGGVSGVHLSRLASPEASSPPAQRPRPWTAWAVRVPGRLTTEGSQHGPPGGGRGVRYGGGGGVRHGAARRGRPAQGCVCWRRA
jgi:hypothetical protein